MRPLVNRSKAQRIVIMLECLFILMNTLCVNAKAEMNNWVRGGEIQRITQWNFRLAVAAEVLQSNSKLDLPLHRIGPACKGHAKVHDGQLHIAKIHRGRRQRMMYPRKSRTKCQRRAERANRSTVFTTMLAQQPLQRPKSCAIRRNAKSWFTQRRAFVISLFPPRLPCARQWVRSANGSRLRHCFRLNRHRRPAHTTSGLGT